MKYIITNNLSQKLFVLVSKELLFLIGICTVQVSCEKELKTDIPIQEKLCLNCILNPDSTIRASLSLSRSIRVNNTFTKANKAQIELIKDGETIEVLQNTSDGLYTLDTKPHEGSQYEIKVTVKGYPELSATTYVPKRPKVNCNITDAIVHQSGLTEYYSYSKKISIYDNNEINRYWLYRFSEFPPGVWSLNGFGDVDSPLIDDFNRIIDATFPLGYYYDYYYLRINDMINNEQTLSINFTSNNNDKIFVMDVDEHYDKYLKSVIKQKMNENNVLFSEPVQIYTNIENGLGIFGSAAITSFKL